MFRCRYSQVAFALSLLVAFQGICQDSADAQDRYAILIGVESYNEFEPLEYAEEDAQDLGNSLKELGYQTTVMTSSAKKSFLKPTNPEKILTILMSRIENCDNDDTLIVCLSGHGIQFKDEELMKTGVRETYFCPEDADTSDKSTLIPINQKIIKMMNDCAAFRKLLLIDACRNEVLSKAARKKGDPVRIELKPVFQNNRSVPGGMAVLFSCSKGQFSWEHPELKHSVFSHYAIQFLNGEADPVFYDGGIDLDNFIAYIRKRTSNFVTNNNLAANGQTPIRLGSGANWPLAVVKELKSYSLEPFDKVRQHARLGIARAQNSLGYSYQQGRGVAKDEAEAVKWFRKAAEQGFANAQHNLGYCYEHGQGVAKDEAEAVKWYRKAAEQGDASGQFNLGYSYQHGQGVAKDEAEAVKWFRKAAEQGYASGQNNLGYCYKNGQGVAKDEAKAVKWYRKAAEQGDASGQNNLGYCYKKGQGVAKDEAEAVKWFRRAAVQGAANAQNLLGYSYLNGEGVAKDEAEAVKWFRKAAEQGFANAQHNLGYCYEHGQGVAKDEAEAVKWYRKSAEQGHASGQNILGYCYEKGQGVAKDEAEAVKWYRKAAEQGDAIGQFSLGYSYQHGQGVAKDEAEAVKWFRKAAEQGYANAQHNLGYCYEHGQGVAKDEAEAVKWYRKSAEQGNDAAKKALKRIN